MKKWLTAILFLSFFIFSLTAQAGFWPGGRPAHVAHRGARAELDENTMEAFKKAVEYGVDMLEFDVQRTSDGVLVIMHDETVDRTTNGHGRIDQMTLAQFQQLRTKSGFVPPTLEEVLSYLKDTKLTVCLDFKIPDTEVVKQLIEVVKKHGLLDRVIFESPEPKVAGEVEKLHPELVTAIYPSNMLLMRHYAKKNSVDVVSYMYPFANPLEVALAHAEGRKVLVWTVDSRGLIKWFIMLKVDGIMTDDPRLFK